MSNGFVFLDECGFVYKRVIIILDKEYIEYEILFESEWNRINSVVNGVL